MAANRRNKLYTRKSSSPSGWFVVGLWVVTLLLIGTTAYSFQSQMTQKGHADVALKWVVILLVLIVIVITYTVQWLWPRRDRVT